MLDSLQQASLRTCTIDDIPWILSLAHRRYRPFDPGRALTWLANAVTNPTMLAIREEHAFCISSIGGYFWFPKEPEAYVVLLCAEANKHWEAIKLLRHSVEWARGKGCVRWWLTSDTEYDFRPLAKRLGCKTLDRYLLDLTDGPEL